MLEEICKKLLLMSTARIFDGLLHLFFLVIWILSHWVVCLLAGDGISNCYGCFPDALSDWLAFPPSDGAANDSKENHKKQQSTASFHKISLLYRKTKDFDLVLPPIIIHDFAQPVDLLLSISVVSINMVVIWRLRLLAIIGFVLILIPILISIFYFWLVFHFWHIKPLPDVFRISMLSIACIDCVGFRPINLCNIQLALISALNVEYMPSSELDSTLRVRARLSSTDGSERYQDLELGRNIISVTKLAPVNFSIRISRFANIEVLELSIFIHDYEDLIIKSILLDSQLNETAPFRVRISYSRMG